LAETLHDLGDLYRIMRRHDKGIRAERRARRIWESLGDRAELSRTLNSLGNFCRIACDYPGARDYYSAALIIQKELGLEQFAATNLNNIGLTHWFEFNFTQAETYFREALAIHERLNVPVEIARVLNNLGAINFVQGLMGESAQFFSRAAALNAGAGAQSEELYNRRNLVEVAMEQGDLRTAVTIGQQVYAASRELGDVSTQAEVGAVLADSYLHAGDYRSARRMHAETTQLASSLRNDELRIYLRIQAASRLCRFGRDTEALAILELIDSEAGQLATRYQHLDILILRMKLASRHGDSDLMRKLYSSGLSEAEAISAPHKAAQLAVAMCSTIEGSLSREAADLVESFLAGRPHWHWAADFRISQARRMMAAGSLDAALELITSTASQLRRDGCWEELWRALVLQGEICHAQADYEPAVRSLDEAASVLKVVASTVDNEEERTAYLDCSDAHSLGSIRDRIVQLVS
jgi:tetratricopeptide (TPR) repeat protein